MKKSRRITVRMKTLAAAVLMALAGLSFSATRQGGNAEATGRAILLQAVQAAGGDSALLAIKNFTVQTETTIFGSQGKTELKITETIELPDKTKQIMALANGSRLQALNGSHSWKQIASDVSPLTALEKREMERGLFRDLINVFQQAQAGKLKVSYIDDERLAGEILRVVQITNEIGDTFKLYIDSNTHLVKKKAYRGAVEIGLAALEETYSDYRVVAGIMLPFHTVVLANGRKFIESVVIDAKFNSPLAKDFFLRK